MDKIKSILVKSIESEIPIRNKRNFDYSLMKLNKIISFIGVRRSGKTSYLYQIMDYLLNKKNISKKNLVYINFEDDRLYPLNGGEFNSIIDNIENIIDYDKSQNVYLFLDEIQNIPNWSRWLRRVQDTKNNFKIFITGSSSKLLSREIATELAGRTISLEVYPLTFKEYLDFKEIKINLQTINYSNHKSSLLKEFNQYLIGGGFPEILQEHENSDLVLQSYFESIFFRDLVERYNIKSINMFSDFLKLLINNTSGIVSLSKMENILKSIGHKVSKSTLSEYLNYAQEVYFIFTLQVFSYKIKDQLIYPKKIYSIDNGLNNAISLKFSNNFGALLENLVFLELKRKNKEMFYFLTKEGLEVDFLIKDNLEFSQLIQVSMSLKEENTKKREFKSLTKAMNELNLNEGLILTLDEDFKEIREVKSENGEKRKIKIIVKPVWKWLLTEV